MRFLFPLILFLASCQEQESPANVENGATPIRIETQRPLMGTLFTVKTYAHDAREGYLAMEEALDLAEDFGNRATDYDPDSELNRLTKSPVGTPIKVSDDLFQVLLLGQKLARETGGIFDPTYGPLTHLWRQTRRTKQVPSEEELAEARSRCGIAHLSFDVKTQTITVLQEGMQLDLGGIAKGFAADMIFDHLKKQGYSQSLVAAAGDLRIGDPPPGKKGWNIGLRTFRLTPTSSLPLRSCAVSTSGDLHQNVIANGQKFSHLIDLRTGLGLTTRRAASVILPEAKLTDPLATAACLSNDPKSILKHYPSASIRVIYEDQSIPPVTTGIFSK
ncbi:MAG: FAD:protein FMN transferase [Akkermansiaceae bacterium]|mgnify:CR=1 FL=1|jgi:thiamine biosynthesis lipoprotein